MGRTNTTEAPFEPDFDAPYTLSPTGEVSESNVPYLPTVYIGSLTGDDVLIEGDGWSTLTNHSGQHGYSGAIMHPSEQWGQWAIDALIEQGKAMGPDYTDAPVTFAVVEVADEDLSYPDGDAIGWAVIYKVEGAQ